MTLLKPGDWVKLRDRDWHDARGAIVLVVAVREESIWYVNRVSDNKAPTVSHAVSDRDVALIPECEGFDDIQYTAIIDERDLAKVHQGKETIKSCTVLYRINGSHRVGQVGSKDRLLLVSRDSELESISVRVTYADDECICFKRIAGL